MIDKKRQTAVAVTVSAAILLALGCQSNDDTRAGSEVPVGTSSAALTTDGGSATPSLGSFAIYASKAVQLSSGASVTGCNVGVETSSGPFLAGGVAAYFSSGSRVPSSETVYASSVYLSSGASLGPIDATNVTSGSGASHGAVSAFPSMPAVPTLPAATAGTTAVSVASGGSKTLASGAYGALTVSAGATLTLTGGNYVFSSLSVSSGATLAVSAATTISVTGAVSFGSGSSTGPTAASGLTAKALSLYVESSSPLTVSSGAKFRGLLVATNALVTVSTSNFTGAVAASQVLVSSGSTVACEDGLTALGCSGPCTDGNPCTTDTCSAGACVSAPVANGTSCNDGSACDSNDTCQAGVCTAGSIVTCSALDACHVAGSCNASTGVCSNPVAANGTSCPIPNATAACQTGSCALAACNAGYANCDGNLANGCETPTTTVANCGGCGTVCAAAPNANAVCVAGSCGLSCAAGFADCDGSPANGCEVNTQTDSGNCGSCGTACQYHDTCQAGACSSAVCQPGFADCDSQLVNECETNIVSDVNNCGGCAIACSYANAAAACATGACAMTGCNPGFADCDGNAVDGCEVSTGSDPSNCGTCGTVCNVPNATAKCGGGACGVGACNAGFADCDGNPANGCEVNVGNDPNNCGSCGGACNLANASAQCTGGSCSVSTCGAGYADCNANPTDGCEVNTSSDSTNCGGCGISCGGAACTAGVCGTLTCSTLTSATTCDAASNCTWVTSSSTCICDSNVPEQVTFIMDASGSVGTAGWAAERSFVVGMIDTGVSPGSYVAVETFSTAVTSAVTFASNQAQSVVNAQVNALPYTAGSTYTKDAVNAAIAQINANDKGLPNVIFLITDGNPNPTTTENPCAAAYAPTITAELQALGATVVLVGVGSDINPTTLSCLYGNDPSHVILASAWTSGDLTSIRSNTDAFLCK